MLDLRPQAQRRNPDELLRHLQSFQLDLKFSAGLWFFRPGAVRFHDRYVDPASIEQRLETAAKLKPYGLQAVEAHYPTEITEDTVDLYRQFCRDTGMRLITVIPNLFFDKDFEFGA